MASPQGVGGLVSWAEVGIYIGVAVVIASLALVVTVSGVVAFLRDVADSTLRATSIELLDGVLLVLMLAEILHTVGISIREHVLVPEPFLIVGLIAAVRRVLVLTAEQGVPTEETAVSFRLVMLELGLLALLVISFVVGLVLLARARRQYGTVGGEPIEQR